MSACQWSAWRALTTLGQLVKDAAAAKRPESTLVGRVLPVYNPPRPFRPVIFGHGNTKDSEDMAKERTLSIIKPDATRRNLTGQINARFEDAGLRIVAQKRLWLTRGQAEAFYAVHKERAFYGDLCGFMISGPVVVQVLEGANAVAKNREVMGATNPAQADAGTIRKDFAESIEANSAHGSDSAENAAIEIAFFFSEIEIVG
jgi:nucleoside-diphosphate kinase